MKSRLLRCGIWILLAGLWATAEAAKDSPSAEMVDSGAFGVFMNGRRVATETFSIRQSGAGSVANSEFKAEQGAEKSVQTSELQLTATGDIRRYEWKEVSPGKAQAVVTPSESFLIERSTGNPQEKPEEHPFLMPASTTVLDDYFFIHREILAWRYLASICTREKVPMQCQANQRTQFGTLNPHARSSMQVTLEFTGREKIAIRGVEQELNRINLKGDSGDWALWLDDKLKLVRILIAGDNTEVVRD